MERNDEIFFSFYVSSLPLFYVLNIILFYCFLFNLSYSLGKMFLTLNQTTIKFSFFGLVFINNLDNIVFLLTPNNTTGEIPLNQIVSLMHHTNNL